MDLGQHRRFGLRAEVRQVHDAPHFQLAPDRVRWVRNKLLAVRMPHTHAVPAD